MIGALLLVVVVVSLTMMFLLNHGHLVHSFLYGYQYQLLVVVGLTVMVVLSFAFGNLLYEYQLHKALLVMVARR